MRGWYSTALHRFAVDLAEGVIVAVSGDNSAVPASFWESPVVALDVKAGELVGAGGVTLARGLRAYAAADVTRRQQQPLGGGRGARHNRARQPAIHRAAG